MHILYQQDNSEVLEDVTTTCRHRNNLCKIELQLSCYVETNNLDTYQKATNVEY